MPPKKPLIALLVVAIIILASAYATLQKQRAKREAHLITLFRQGKTLECQGLKVSEREFNLVSGTLSFVGKARTPHHGVTISLDSCDEPKGKR